MYLQEGEKNYMGKIALFGAAGAIGHSLADALRARGQEYRVVGRDRSRLEKAFVSDPGAEIVTWNPDDPASVRAAASGIDTIVYLVGVPYDHFELRGRSSRQFVVYRVIAAKPEQIFSTSGGE